MYFLLIYDFKLLVGDILFSNSSIEKGRKSFKLFLSGFGNLDYRSICLYLDSLDSISDLNKEFFVDMCNDNNISSVFNNLFLFISRQDQILAEHLENSEIRIVPIIGGKFSSIKDLCLTDASNISVCKLLKDYLFNLQPDEKFNIPSSGLDVSCLCRYDKNKSIVSLLANDNNYSKLPLGISYWCLLQCVSSNCSSLAVVQNTICRIGSVGGFSYKSPTCYEVQNYVICFWCLDYLKTLFTFICKYSKTQQNPNISGFSSWSKDQGFEFNTTICYLINNLVDCLYCYSNSADLRKFRDIVLPTGNINLNE